MQKRDTLLTPTWSDLSSTVILLDEVQFKSIKETDF